MFAALVAALSGLIWGVADFAGGKATQRASALSVTWLSKVASLPLLALFLALTAGTPHPAALLWGAAAGLFGTVGLVVFYRAMSRGAMTVVAPVTAVVSAALPVLLGLALGERPGPVRLTGVSCAVLAIGLVSLAGGRTAPELPGRRVAPDGAGHRVAHPVVPRPGLRVILAATVAGAGFAGLFVCLREAGQVAGGGSGLWPNASAQLVALALTTVLMLPARPALPRRRALGWTLVAGSFDLTANVLYLVAARSGDLSLVAPLAALYPVTTVLLAVLIDRERLRAVQGVGLGLAVAALVLVSR